MRMAVGSKIKECLEQTIQVPDSLFLLQWDGKMLEGFHHVDKKVEHVAITLHSLNEPQKSNILPTKGLHNIASTAKNEALLIQNELEKYPEVKNKIIGFYFDTTAVNTRLQNDIITRLQHYLGRKLLLLACRHHIFELCCGAACQEIIGDTTSPFEKLFSVLKLNWDKININQLNLFEIYKLPRNLRHRTEEILLFCQEFL